MKRVALVAGIVALVALAVDDVRLRLRVAELEPRAEAGDFVCFAAREHFKLAAERLRGGNPREIGLAREAWHIHVATALRCLGDTPPPPPNIECTGDTVRCDAEYAEALVERMPKYPR